MSTVGESPPKPEAPTPMLAVNNPPALTSRRRSQQHRRRCRPSASRHGHRNADAASANADVDCQRVAAAASTDADVGRQLFAAASSTVTDVDRQRVAGVERHDHRNADAAIVAPMHPATTPMLTVNEHARLLLHRQFAALLCDRKRRRQNVGFDARRS